MICICEAWVQVLEGGRGGGILAEQKLCQNCPKRLLSYRSRCKDFDMKEAAHLPPFEHLFYRSSFTKKVIRKPFSE